MKIEKKHTSSRVTKIICDAKSTFTFRHVLFNGGYQSLIIRMALLTLICDAYISWAQSAEAGEFFEKEYEFYVMCLKLFIGKRLG